MKKNRNLTSAKRLSEELAIWGKYGLDVILDNHSIMIDGLNEDKWSSKKWFNNEEQDKSIVEISLADKRFLSSRKWFWDQAYKRWRKLI